MRLGIVGYGYVGRSTEIMIPKDHDIVVYDSIPRLCIPKGASLSDISECDLVFVCLPTPMENDGRCHVDIIKKVLGEIREVDQQHCHLHRVQHRCDIIIRSTVPVGFCDSISCFFLPEFITEKNWIEDVRKSEDFVMGVPSVIGPRGLTEALGSDQTRVVSLLQTLLSSSLSSHLISGDRLHVFPNREVELSKLVRNSFLASKVSFFNEINSLCDSSGMDYSSIREMVTLDGRIGSSHMAVPGTDGRFGFGGTCFVKDIWSLKTIFSDSGVESPILDAVVHRNEEVDRKERDWEDSKGRAVI